MLVVCAHVIFPVADGGCSVRALVADVDCLLWWLWWRCGVVMVGQISEVVCPDVGAKLVHVSHGSPSLGTLDLVFEVLWCIMCVL